MTDIYENKHDSAFERVIVCLTNLENIRTISFNNRLEQHYPIWRQDIIVRLVWIDYSLAFFLST